MARILGVECKKQAVYLAVADAGELVEAEPQRLDVPAIHEQTERLRAFLNDFGHLLTEAKPDAVHILQPETNYTATYSEFAPKAALETLIRLACLDAGIDVEIVHRASVRSALGSGKGNVEKLIETNIQVVGKYWNAGRNLAAAAALTAKGGRR
jgi:hypothetical protein